MGKYKYIVVDNGRGKILARTDNKRNAYACCLHVVNAGKVKSASVHDAYTSARLVTYNTGGRLGF